MNDNYVDEEVAVLRAIQNFCNPKTPLKDLVARHDKLSSWGLAWDEFIQGVAMGYTDSEMLSWCVYGIVGEALQWQMFDEEWVEKDNGTE